MVNKTILVKLKFNGQIKQLICVILVTQIFLVQEYQNKFG